jgi:hypothetical protein
MTEIGWWTSLLLEGRELYICLSFGFPADAIPELSLDVGNPCVGRVATHI